MVRWILLLASAVGFVACATGSQGPFGLPSGEGACEARQALLCAQSAQQQCALPTTRDLQGMTAWGACVALHGAPCAREVVASCGGGALGAASGFARVRRADCAADAALCAHRVGCEAEGACVQVAAVCLAKECR
jgi:hypothetical protein